MTVPKINSAHGSDTRNVINRAIEVLNQLGINVQDLVAEGQLTPEQYATLIQTINGLISKGNVTIFDIDKNKGLLDSTFFTSEFLSELNDGVISSTEVLPGSLTTEKYARSSVTIEKTNFLEVASNNLLNRNDFLANSRLSSSGNIQNYSNGNLSHFITVRPGENYTMYRAFQYAYYNSNQEFISLHDSDVTTTISPPANAYYLRIIVLHTNMDRAQVNEGSELLAYDEYAVKLKNELPGFTDFMTEENESWVI